MLCCRSLVLLPFCYEVLCVSKDISQPRLKKTLFTALSLTVKPLFNAGIPVSVLRPGLAISAKTTLTARGMRATPLTMRDVPAALCARNPNTPHAILSFHGGAYRAGSWRTPAALTSHLAAHSDAAGSVPNNRLAPVDPCPAALNDAMDCYAHVLRQGY